MRDGGSFCRRIGQSEITTEEIAALREFKRLGVWFDTEPTVGERE